MKITITGATGFIGKHLLQTYPPDKHSLIVLGRGKAGFDERIHFSFWDGQAAEPGKEALEHSDAVIHLAGETIAQRWTPEAKQRIVNSRSAGTRNLVSAIARCRHRPRVLVSASAIGFYGDRGEEVLTESSPPGRGFTAEVCQLWEAEADRASEYGVRVVKIRIGVVLGSGGGALQKMTPIFQWGLGGPLGGGNQWMSWIHVEDLVRIIHRAVADSAIDGVWNGVAPEPVRNRDFTRELAAVLRRPALFSAPAFAMKLILGEMSQMVLSSQRIHPAAALAANFQFIHPNLSGALRSILA